MAVCLHSDINYGVLMRYCLYILLLLTVIISCSKTNNARTNFAELTVGTDKFVFDSLVAVFDTTTQEINCNLLIFDRATNSNMVLETSSGSRWINGAYTYPAVQFPGRSIVFMHLQTYIDRVPGTYNLQDNDFTLTIDQSENGRMHGTFSGKVICYTCTPYGKTVDITKGEFEMAYSYR
jgi:hypothetical protein